MTTAHFLSSTMMDGHSCMDSSNDFRHRANSCNYNLSEWWYQLQRRLKYEDHSSSRNAGTAILKCTVLAANVVQGSNPDAVNVEHRECWS
ncbi:hypothetical protein HYFRA_00011116 [Hymenoscyphus fraxineus]|uniref:Uncharacterized protein n=1 Tax=Hymenoscyphus fraxineus TaxID=746836 RepID=A0A9N9L2T0_9HELO|nr:hypothetical protein HYFRA_00011116 [Hymenoscyphus fraxineus]